MSIEILIPGFIIRFFAFGYFFPSSSIRIFNVELFPVALAPCNAYNAFIFILLLFKQFLLLEYKKFSLSSVHGRTLLNSPQLLNLAGKMCEPSVAARMPLVSCRSEICAHRKSRSENCTRTCSFHGRQAKRKPRLSYTASGAAELNREARETQGDLSL